MRHVKKKKSGKRKVRVHWCALFGPNLTSWRRVFLNDSTMSDNTGAEYITGIFRDSEDSFDAISSVQQENRVRISSMEPALPILDLHGITRAEIHTSLFQKMQEKLLAKVDELESRALMKLLDRCFRYVGGDPQLRAVCLQIMQKLPSIDDKYLRPLSENLDLYNSCPLGVKQQIWQTNQGLFGEAVSPLLDQYISDKESLLFGVQDKSKNSPSFLSIQPKVRRQNSVIQELVSMLGTSATLYTTLLQFLRTLFLRTQISHYCTLRADLLMTLHEKESKLCELDRCRKFAWCLDACVRAGGVDSKKTRELYSFIEDQEPGDEILGDISMLLRDPYALHTISKSILQNTIQLFEHTQLPRENDDLECLVRLLQLGLKSLRLIDTKEFYEDKLDTDLLVRFLPDLISLMVENNMRALNRQLGEDHTPFAPSANFTKYLTKHTPAMYITCMYATHLLERKEMKSLLHLLPLIAQAYTGSTDGTQMPDVFLHILVHHVTFQQDVGRVATLQTMLREFWIPCCQASETVLLHLCRLLWKVHDRLSTPLLEEVLDAMRPGSELSQATQEQYVGLIEHIKSSRKDEL